MDDLTEYFSDKDKIAKLEARPDLLQKRLNNTCREKNRYKKERNTLAVNIAELERQLICAKRTASRYKRLYEEVRGEKELNRGGMATILINELKGTGKPGRLIQSIADRCFLSYGTISKLWYCPK